MADDKLKKKYYGFVTCLTRIILASCIMFKGRNDPGDMPVWIPLAPLYLIAFCMAGCITGKTCRVTSVNNRPLSSKEGKNCARKAYIYTAIIIGTIGFAVGFYLDDNNVRYVLGYDYLGPLVIAICLIMDIAFIKPKNFKYACKSY